MGFRFAQLLTSNTFIHPSTIVDEGCTIHAGAKIWHFCHLISGCEIGPDCSIGQGCMVGPGVKLGRNVRVQNNVSLYEGVVCEDDVFIGPSAVFTNVYNPRSAVPRKHEYRTTLLRRGATVGANATIVCGTNIGEYAFVGAGAVVNRDVLPFALVVGNPARQIGWMSEYGQRLAFDAAGTATCPESGEQYLLVEGKVRKG